MIHPENPHCATMRSSQTEGADQACPTDQILSSPRIEALGNRLVYLVLRKNSMPLSSQRDLTFRIASSRSFVSWLETLLVAEVYSPDRIFAHHRIDA
jgi:hypothetical protein